MKSPVADGLLEVWRAFSQKSTTEQLRPCSHRFANYPWRCGYVCMRCGEYISDSDWLAQGRKL